ncbi:MAG TPA: peptidase M28, partial [Cyclobacteriaceae bacterium]|nr:peptidase M28 [Cyclobacteriaceae bacterium]
PGVDLKQLVAEWRAEYYLGPQDGPDGIFDYEAGKKYVQLNFLISYQVAQADGRPYWLENDFFGGRYGKKRQENLSGSR